MKMKEKKEKVKDKEINNKSHKNNMEEIIQKNLITIKNESIIIIYKNI
jgi:hypothetical protein